MFSLVINTEGFHMPRGIGGGWTFDDVQPEVAALPGDDAVRVDGGVEDDSNGVGRGQDK